MWMKKGEVKRITAMKIGEEDPYFMSIQETSAQPALFRRNDHDYLFLMILQVRIKKKWNCLSSHGTKIYYVGK